MIEAQLAQVGFLRSEIPFTISRHYSCKAKASFLLTKTSEKIA